MKTIETIKTQPSNGGDLYYNGHQVGNVYYDTLSENGTSICIRLVGNRIPFEVSIDTLRIPSETQTLFTGEEKVRYELNQIAKERGLKNYIIDNGVDRRTQNDILVLLDIDNDGMIVAQKEY